MNIPVFATKPEMGAASAALGAASIRVNDPPADFETSDPYIAVELDEKCRRQQLSEAWFATLDDVPRRAISMSVRQIMKSRAIVCTGPDERKAAAVRDAVEGSVSRCVPASILQKHENETIFLDRAAAPRLGRSQGRESGVHANREPKLQRRGTTK